MLTRDPIANPLLFEPTLGSPGLSGQQADVCLSYQVTIF